VRFHALPLTGAHTVALEPRSDDRGFFARLFCAQEFAAAGLEARFVQVNDSLSGRKGTLRGLHYQLPPAAEVKLVRCVRGVLWDVIVDLRPDSPSFKGWCAAELSAENRLMMYVPRGFAHGFLTLQDDSEVVYMVSSGHDPLRERGIRWNDPAIGIAWPAEPVEISARDAEWPDLDAAFHGIPLLRSFG
jgi:dTDP-4-dehydrorhamnose 3,5-epimerase